MKSGSSYLVAGFFFLSGAAGLIYEVAWTRMFAVVAGGTTRALTAVLVAYMAGLALGSFLGGRWVDRQVRRPVLVYGLLEGGIGLMAILLPFFIPAVLPALKLGLALFRPDSFAFDFFRFLTSALVLVLPTTLMGATFPVLLRGLLSQRERFGLFAGLLYATNSLGAMTGALVSGFALIPAFGLRATVWSAAGVNLLILALVLGLPWVRELTAEPRLVEEKPGAEDTGPGWQMAVLLWGYGASGLCAMVYQVGWARVLALALSNSTYALGLILAAYIGGLALGGMVITPLADRLKQSWLWAAGLEVFIGLSALAVVPLFERVTAGMFTWSLSFYHRFGAYQAFRFATAFGLILAPTFAMGALFPVVVKMAGMQKRGVGEPAGQVYAANTVGAILGAFLAGQVLIRWWGVETALLLATGLSVVIGLCWLLVSGLNFRLRLGLAGASAAVILAALLRIPAWDPLLMNSGPYLYSQFYVNQLQQGVSVRDILNNYRLRYYRDGMEAMVSVLESRNTGELSLRINGKADASSQKDMPSQVLTAHIPLLLHPAPKKVMVLGLASGVTAGSALLHPEVERLDCVEISPEVAEASHYFEPVSHLNYQDPRFHLILDDARNFLALSSGRYDVITIESTNPWIAGIGQLFTREFFQLLRDHLEPGGIALIFLPAYDMDADTIKMAFRTYLEVFPYSSLWESIPGSDYLLAGSAEARQLDWNRWQARATAPAIAADLARIGFRAGDFFPALVMGPERLAQVAGSGPLHTDDRRQLEFVMPKLLASPQRPRMNDIIREIFSRHGPAPGSAGPGEEGWKTRLAEFDQARSLYYQAYLSSSPEKLTESDLETIIRVWREALAASRETYLKPAAAKELAEALLGRAEVRREEGYDLGAVADWEEAFQLDPLNYAASDRLIDYYQEVGDREKARAWAEKALEHLPRDAFALAVLGNLAQEENQLAEAERKFRAALESSPRSAKFRWNLAVVLADQGKLAAAEREFLTLVESEPGNPDYLIALAMVLKDQKRPQEAEPYLQRARKLAPDHPMLQEFEGNQ